MPKLTDVPLGSRALRDLEPLFRNGDAAPFEEALRSTASRLDGRTVWHINSTAEGGGVAEMLQAQLPYLIDAGWNVCWTVISGDAPFFDLTKGLHHTLHGSEPADGIRDDFEQHYGRVSEENAKELVERVKPGDVAIIHDPQTAGLIGPLKEAGVLVSWQCHIGADEANDSTRLAWDLLRPHIEPADRYVFSREAYLWEGLDAAKLRIIPPAIDALSEKNRDMSDDEIGKFLGDLPIEQGQRVVLEVSRWDRLKDPIGFIRMFADHLIDIEDVHAVYAGPSTEGVEDDPEGAEVHAACEEVWRSLPDATRERVHLLSIPMDDVDANARIINALQRRAEVVVQKSIKEGFGLTVAEAMWKQRPVVGSRVGGIQDQIEDGTSGLLVDDPYDIDGFASAAHELLSDRARARQMGKAAHERVMDEYLAPRMLRQYAELVDELIGESA